MTPGEVLDAALARVGATATVRGRDFSITGSITGPVARVDGYFLAVSMPLPRPARDRSGGEHLFHDFEVPLALVEAIEP